MSLRFQEQATDGAQLQRPEPPDILTASMKIFLSWSGVRSRELALGMSTWLRDVVQHFEPWMSESDIPAGAMWSAEIMSNLASADAGILVVTPENRVEPWVLFEAGALANRFGTESKVCVYLLGLRKTELSQGPLSVYQLSACDRIDTMKMVRMLNASLGAKALQSDVLERSFERCWPELDAVITKLSTTAAASANLLRSTEDTLAHMLEEMRRVREQNERLLYLVDQREQALASTRPRSDDTDSAQKASFQAHATQDDLLRAARERLREAAATMHPELLHLIDGATLILGSDGLYEMAVQTADTFYRLREPIDQIARKAGLGWGIHLRCEQLEREALQRELVARERVGA